MVSSLLEPDSKIQKFYCPFKSDMLRLVANREEEDVRSKSKERDNIVCLGEFNIIE